MSTSATLKSNKSGKPSKPSKPSKASSKTKPHIEIACKFRGKYDLNKKKNDKEINLENAVNLFEVIYKKNENLFKDTNIKMFKEKKMFSFGDKKGLKKDHHRIPYNQVNKFFVLHRDPTMIIMGVHHKTHKWFLVFQFNNVEDLTRFCDEIEGEKKINSDNNGLLMSTDDIQPMADDVPKIQIDSEDIVDSHFPYENSNDFEKISIHSAMLNTKENELMNFNDSYYEPDLNPQVAAAPEAVSICSSRPSSRSSSDTDFNDRVHCDDLSQSKLKDLLMKRGSTIYLDIENWEEDLTCINYSNSISDLKEDKTGPIYMYCAQFRNKDGNKLLFDDSQSLSSDDESKFHHYRPKLVQSNDNDLLEFKHHEPKFTNDKYQDFNHFEPKFTNDKSQDFNHFEPKLLNDNSEVFNHHEPKLLNGNKEMPKFEHYNPKLIANEN